MTKAAPSEAWELIHEIADRFSPDISDAFLRLIDQLENQFSIQQITEALERGEIVSLFEKLPVPLRTEEFRTLLGKLVEEAAFVAAEVAAFDMRFDITNPEAVAWIKNQAGALITHIGESTRGVVRNIMEDAFVQGLTINEQAALIREVVGLTPQQVKAVVNYRSALAEKVPKISPARIVRLAEQYAERLLRYRARTIARTETIRAATQGQIQLWKQAREKDLLSRTARYKWIVTPDDRLCPICEAIPEMNPKGVQVGELFETDAGPLDGPPAHPNCRCAVGIQEQDDE